MADEEKKTSTEDAFIDDFALEIQDIDDAFEKSIAQYEFPYRDGAKLEDMGLKARKVRFKCFFFGKRYDEHKLFLEHIKGNKGLFDFTHPKYGLLHGSVESASVRHDDRLETAEIDISFVEEFAGEIEIPAVSVDGVFEQGQAEQIAEFEKDVKDELGAEAAEILGKELDPTKGILEQFTGLTATARAYVKQIDGYVSKLEATLTSIANPANSLLATIDYGVNLPGRVIGSVSRTVERYALLAESLKTAPSRFAQSMKNGMKELESALGGFSKHIHLAGSQRT
ncbi:MAG: DNA circularization N-terminal domain-containing protein, partial [Thermodesulfovibrionales bacterium]|nr:DNA circularization N-terminal domain-containing protein [Thermodesulfovibrionales bacterium]